MMTVRHQQIICGSTHGAWDDYGNHCSVCRPPDPRDAEIAQLKVDLAHAQRMIKTERLSRQALLAEKAEWQMEAQRTQFAQVRAEKAEADLAAHKRALAAGPAALRRRGPDSRILAAADTVKAAQEAALKGGG